MNADHEIVFVFAKPVEAEDGTIEFKLHHDLNENYLIGRFALEFAEDRAGARRGARCAFARGAADAGRAAERAADEADRGGLQEDAAPAKAEAKANPDIASLMVMRDLPEPRPTFIFQRGDFLRPDEKTGPLTPGVLAAVSAAMPRAAARVSQPARPRALAGRSGESAHPARHREPHLDALLRQGPGGDG